MGELGCRDGGVRQDLLNRLAALTSEIESADIAAAVGKNSFREALVDAAGRLEAASGRFDPVIRPRGLFDPTDLDQLAPSGGMADPAIGCHESNSDTAYGEPERLF